MPDQPLLQVDDLCVDYLTNNGDVRVVDDVSFTIGAGDVLGLAGESGSGKTTVVQALLRLLGPPAAITGGRVTLQGDDVLAMGDEQLRDLRWRRISMVMQSAMNALNPVLTVGDQIADAIVAHDRVSRKQCDERVAGLLELVNIDPERARSYPHELSGGMRQRVVIAMALALKPPLVIMDEPTTALDVVVQREILMQIAALKEKLGFSILFITHDMSLLLDFCSHIGVLYSGRLVETGPVQALAGAPRHPYTKGLLGSIPDVREAQEELHGIPGAPPDPRDPPSGCRFHPRCPLAEDRCRHEVPGPQLIGPEHRVACHLVQP